MSDPGRGRVPALRHLRLSGRSHRRHRPRARPDLDMDGFEREMAGRRSARAPRASSAPAPRRSIDLEGETDFTGYEDICRRGHRRGPLPRRRGPRSAGPRRRAGGARRDALLCRVRRPGRRPRHAGDGDGAASASRTPRSTATASSATSAKSSTASCRWAIGSPRASTASAAAPPRCTTRRPTCCTRRCGRCWASTCSSAARWSARTGCASTSPTSSR
jgi:hypothetical protein